MSGPLKAADDWLVTRWQWPYAAAFAGILLLILVPLIVPGFGWAGALIFLQLPIYLLHQLEEHAGDRFREWVNREIGHGIEVLSRRATFVINSLGVWGFDLLAFYLAVFVEPSLGLMALYLPAVNSVGHILPALRTRCANPGVWTALGLFLPLSVGGIFLLSGPLGAEWGDHFFCFGAALAVHVAIVVHVQRKLRVATR